MISTLQSYAVLVPGVTGGDVVKTGTILNVSNCSPKFKAIDVRWLDDGYIVKQDPVAETLAIWTVTPPATPTVGSTYGYNITQVTPFIQASPAPGIPTNPGTNTVNYPLLSTAITGGTKVTLMQAIQHGLNNLVNPLSNIHVSSAVDGTTGVQTITALAGYPLVNLVQLSTDPVGLTLANGTPGVASIGTYNDLLRAGVDAQYIITGHTYGNVVFTYQVLIVSGDRTVNLTYTQTLYVDHANSTNYTNFFTALKTAVGAVFP